MIRRRISGWATAARVAVVIAPLVLLPVAGALVFVGCSSDDEGGNPDTSPIAWVSPAPGAVIGADEVVELSVKVNDHSAQLVRFAVDGNVIGTCDTTAGPNECRRDDLFRLTTTFHDVGPHTLVATAPGAGGDLTTTLSIAVTAAPHVDEPDAGPIEPVDRGFLDPDRPPHNVFDGVSWSVAGQEVMVESPPTGASTLVIATCMKTYGASIIKYADLNKVSRGSVVATAITESNCTDPAGSSDGLSSGPMQVTGSTCAAVVTGYTSAACKTKMYEDPDFSFLVGVKYMGSTYQLAQHAHDPPKIAAAYNAGSIRQSTANRWHMVVTGNHIERWVAAYNAYREWESLNGIAKLALEVQISGRAAARFDGEHVPSASALPKAAPEGQVVFVGDWARRDGAFVVRRGGAWRAD